MIVVVSFKVEEENVMPVLLDLYKCWFKIGLFTFGGGYAMLPMIEREIIEKKRWATEDEIMDYYAIAQCTPGAIAANTATFVGFKIKGYLGGIISTLGVVSPSIIIISLIAALIENFQDLAIVQHALAGISVSVCVLMFVSIEKLLKKGIRDFPTGIIFALAFILAYFTNISTVLLVVAAGAAGYVLYAVHSRKEKKV